MEKKSGLGRREFLKTTAAIAGGIGIAATAKTTVQAADRQNMCGFAAPKLEKVRIGHVGLGMRGPGAVSRMSKIDAVEIVALCDLYEDRVNRGQRILAKNGRPKAKALHGSEDAWKPRSRMPLPEFTVTGWATCGSGRARQSSGGSTSTSLRVRSWPAGHGSQTGWPSTKR